MEDDVRPVSQDGTNPVIIKDWDEWAAYLAKHLKPVGHGPRGQPIYDHDQVEALNVRRPDDVPPEA